MKKALFTKYLSLIFALVLIFALSACTGDRNGQNEASSAAENVPTEKQIWLPYTMLDHAEKCRRTYYYDEYGNEIKTTKEDLNGNLQATWISEYNDDNDLIKRSVDTGNGAPFVQLIQTYDDKGHLIEKREITKSSESVFTYRYDEQNRLISKSNGERIVETYTYEADGSYMVQKVNKADEYSLYRADGKIKERHVSPNIKLVYSYNADGVLVECVTYSGENITQKTVYHLDENGNAIKITQVSASGNEIVMGEYEYKLYTVKVE